MPLQNRVDPWGQLQAVDSRGALLGNRGIIHNEKKHIVAQWRSKAWITCQIQFKGRESPIFAPDSYSQLFFVDEATAFAAGHRPCAECRRDRYNEFKAAWVQSNREQIETENPSVIEIDKVLHSERVFEDKRKRTFAAQIGTLPQGTFVVLEGKPLLLWRGKLFEWSFDGYSRSKSSLSPSLSVAVLTPGSIVRLFASGFTPQVHVSAYS
jgi:hypothetical protein